MARKRPGLKPSIGLGAACGLLAAWGLDTAWEPNVNPAALVIGGMVLGLLHNFWRYPDDNACRIWWVFGGCGGSSTIYDTDGHSRPRRPCWGHPASKPKRLVNLVVVPVQIAIVVGLVVFAVAVVKGGQPPP